MAKGNDGNFLQHSVEVAVAERLRAENPAGLHIALTHGMAPFEKFDLPLSAPQRGLMRCHLKLALRLSGRDTQEDEPLIVSAYRRTRASDTHYPNSAELLRAIRGESGLAGGITETCPTKYPVLARAWRGSSVNVCHASWRSQVRDGGVLACPDDLQTPWLFSMDPMTFAKSSQSTKPSHESCDDDKLHEADMTLLRRALTAYAQSNQPGVATLFVYGANPERQQAFWQSAKELAACVSTACPNSGLHCYSLTHRGGNRNLVALFYFGLHLPHDFIDEAVEEIEDIALAAMVRRAKPEREYANSETIMSILEGRDGNEIRTQL